MTKTSIYAAIFALVVFAWIIVGLVHVAMSAGLQKRESMRNNDTNRWYLLTIVTLNEMRILVSSPSLKEAIKKVRYPGMECHGKRLSWRELSKITGCVIPTHATPEEAATGMPIFCADGKYTSLYVQGVNKMIDRITLLLLIAMGLLLLGMELYRYWRNRNE